MTPFPSVTIFDSKQVNVSWVSLLSQLAMEDYFIRLGQIYYSKLEINSSFRENIIKVGIKGTSCDFAYFAQSK